MVEIFELTFGKVFTFIETLLRLIIPSEIYLTKIFIFLLSIILSSFLIFTWIKLELKNQDEIDYWQSLLKSRRDYKFIKSQKKNFEKIKKIFSQDKVKGLVAIDDFLKQIIEMFGYSAESLEEKIDQLPQEIFKSKEEVKKAIKIVSLIKEKEQANLRESEYYLVFDTYQKFLLDIGAITNDSLLVMDQPQPEE